MNSRKNACGGSPGSRTIPLSGQLVYGPETTHCQESREQGPGRACQIQAPNASYSPAFPFDFHTPSMASAFFYGTLMHPKILKRVIGNDGSYLEIRPALLLVSARPPTPLLESNSALQDYTRHKINVDEQYIVVQLHHSLRCVGRRLPGYSSLL